MIVSRAAIATLKEPVEVTGAVHKVVPSSCTMQSSPGMTCYALALLIRH
jgi:hypothetical protein